MFKSLITIAAASSLIASTAVAAVTYSISSPVGEIARTSTSAELPIGFNFQLGTFNDFVPSLGNASSWQTNWVPIVTTEWESAFGPFNAFTGTQDLNNNSQALANKQLYIWGYNTQIPGTGTEWVLFNNTTDADWIVPTVIADPVVKFIDLIDTGTSATVGSLFAQGNDPYFQTAAVVPEPAHYAGILGAVALLVGLIRRRK